MSTETKRGQFLKKTRMDQTRGREREGGERESGRQRWVQGVTPPSPVFCAPAAPVSALKSSPPGKRPMIRDNKKKTLRDSGSASSAFLRCRFEIRSAEKRRVWVHFLCLVQAARHVQTPDNLPLCLTLSPPTPPHQPTHPPAQQPHAQGPGNV